MSCSEADPEKANVQGKANFPGSADVPVGTANENAKDKANETPNPREWYSRGYLPHRDSKGLIQSITYRIADSLPQSKLKSLEEELREHPQNVREIEKRKQIEVWLDAGMGSCALAHPEVAQYVQNSFKHFHGDRYTLHAWCVMPNHVHVLLEPHIDLGTIIQGWKSFTSRWILAQNDRLGLRISDSNQLWMREYWDRFIRDSNHYEKALNYIHHNPVKAGLCRRAGDWQWSSAYVEQADEDVSAPGDCL